MRRFLAIHEVPAGGSDEDVREVLGRIAERSHARGIHPQETFYAPASGRAYTFFEVATAAGEDTVRGALVDAGLHEVEILAGERVFTELLDEPRRAR